ncbi:MAG: glycosyltransferase family 2 protein [Aureispira sp.]|nr:glycosyltransferase family 2 protein [Aureispira sp.]
MKDISVIFPAYNEVERIRPTLHSFDQELAKTAYNYELLVVDDGSTDGTADFVESLRILIPNLRVIRCVENQGKGHAVKVGMLNALGKIRVMADADGATPASELKALVQPILDGKADISIGSRYVEGAIIAKKQPWYRRVWSRLANRVIQRVLLPGIVDTQCGFKAFRAEAADVAFNYVKTNGWSFDLEILAYAKSKGFRIREVPVCWTDDERSKGKFWDAPKTIVELYRIRKRLKLQGA